MHYAKLIDCTTPAALLKTAQTFLSDKTVADLKMIIGTAATFTDPTWTKAVLTIMIALEDDEGPLLLDIPRSIWDRRIPDLQDVLSAGTGAMIPLAEAEDVVTVIRPSADIREEIYPVRS